MEVVLNHLHVIMHLPVLSILKNIFLKNYLGYWLDQLVVGSHLNWMTGKLYYGNIVYGKSPSNVSSSVISGLSAGCQLIQNNSVINFSSIYSDLSVILFF